MAAVLQLFIFQDFRVSHLEVGLELQLLLLVEEAAFGGVLYGA